MKAAEKNRLEVVQALLAADADPNIKDVSAPPAMPREGARGSGGGPHPVIAPALLASLFYAPLAATKPGLNQSQPTMTPL